MTMKRRAGIAGIAFLVAVAAAITYCRGRASHAPAGASSGSGHATGVRVADQAGRHIDPRTLARGSIAGTVTDERHAPVAHARVCVDTSSNDLSEELVRVPHCTETDDRGHYALPDLFAAGYRVSAMAKPYRPAVYHPAGNSEETLFELAADEHRTDIDLVLRDGGVAVTGTVADVTGGPIGHAVVRATSTWWRERDATPAVETDDAGKFEMWVSPGPIELAGYAEGYTSGSDDGTAPGVFEILLTPESSIAGTVLDAKTQQPVEGVAVDIEMSEGVRGSANDFTDDRGHFRVTHLLPGRYVAVATSASGYGHSDGSIRVGLGQHVDVVVILLHPAYRIEGRVVLPDAKHSTCKESSLQLHDAAASRYLMADREPDGTLHLEGVLPGTYGVEVGCIGYLERDKYPPIVIAGKDATGLEWPVDLGATIRGRVTTKSGQPVDGADVSTRSTEDGRGKPIYVSDRSRSDGTYKLEGLRAGKYSVGVLSLAGQPPRDGWTVEVRAGATVVQDLVLDDTGQIKGVVVDAEARPVAGVQVTAEAIASGDDSEEDSSTARTTADGTFTISNLRAGDYRLSAYDKWSRDLRKPGTNDDAKHGERVVVHVNQTATARLVIESQTGVINGSVVDADGKPVNDAYVIAARESDAAGSERSAVADTRWSDDDHPVVTGLDGKFAITKLAPGTYTIRAYRKGGGEGFVEHVPVGGTAKVRLQRTGSIAGKVTREGGVPDELDISITDPKTEFSRDEAFYKTGGLYVLRDLPPGHFTITADAARGHKQATVDLAEGETKTGVDIELDPLVTLTGRVVELGTKVAVAGIAMSAAAGLGTEVDSGDDRENISDEAGRFSIKNTPIGPVTLTGMPVDEDTSPYGVVYASRTITGTGTIDIGDVAITRKRLHQGDHAGELGLHFVDQPDDTPADQEKFQVSWIDPQGPAARTAIKVGDVITTVDGVDVTGAAHGYGDALMEAPAGTTLTLGLARGITVAITLAAP